MPISELTDCYLENVPCTNNTQKILSFKIYVAFFKITRLSWIILILHPGHRCLFLETITIKFMGPMVEDRNIEQRDDAQEKQILSVKTMILLKKEKVVN